VAEVTLSATVRSRILRVDLQLVHDSQIELTSPWTGASEILNRGYAAWTGTVSFGPFEASSEAAESAALEVEAFLAALDGRANWFELPHYRAAAALASGTTVASSSLDGDGVLSHELSAAPPAALGAGQAVRAGGRMFRVRAAAGTSVTLDPQRPIADGSAIAGAATVRAAAAETSSPAMALTPGLAGPWTLSWREHGGA